jgi:hypothetical protein
VITKREAERDPKELQDMLELYASAIVNLIPSMDTYTTSQSPTLRHEDLCLENIFVSVNNDKVTVTSLIDWSCSWVGPRYLYNWIPEFLRLPELPGGEERPVALPPNFDELDEKDKTRIRTEVDITKCRVEYEGFRELHDPTLAPVCRSRLFDMLRAMVSWSDNIWNNKFVPVCSSSARTEASQCDILFWLGTQVHG